MNILDGQKLYFNFKVIDVSKHPSSIEQTKRAIETLGELNRKRIRQDL